ncbi:MAG: hypothetical protein ACFE94_06045 [Candidatus Hodarchaeota archaeon]
MDRKKTGFSNIDKMTAKDKGNIVKEIFETLKSSLTRILIEAKKILLLKEVIKDATKFYMDFFTYR